MAKVAAAIYKSLVSMFVAFELNRFPYDGSQKIGNNLQVPATKVNQVICDIQVYDIATRSRYSTYKSGLKQYNVTTYYKKVRKHASNDKRRG